MRRSLLSRIAFSLTALAVTRPLAAQVGNVPERSPYVDIESRQNFTALGGWFFADTDPAHVAPQSGPVFGAQYDVFLGGPAWFTARLREALVDRTVIDPARPAGSRILGTERRPLTMADVGFTFALTGQKSYRGLVPLVHGGVGFATNFEGADPGGLDLGTRFAFAYGGGLRYVPNGHWAIRADLGWHAFQLRYPDRYFQVALDSTAVLISGSSKSSWLNNKTVTLGATYQLFR
jgi:hypothetical protein